MRKLAMLAAGSLIALGALCGTSSAAPLSQTLGLAPDVNEQPGLIDQVRHRGWRHGWRGRHYGWRHGRHYGWYGPPRYYDDYGPPRRYGYYRPYRPRAGIYFGFGGPGFYGAW